jgi:hypothetical protein
LKVGMSPSDRKYISNIEILLRLQERTEMIYF